MGETPPHMATTGTPGIANWEDSHDVPQREALGMCCEERGEGSSKAVEAGEKRGYGSVVVEKEGNGGH